MDQLKPPNALRFEGNIGEVWKKFKQRIELYFTATGLSEKSDKVKIAAFLHVAGEEAVTVFNGFKWDEAGDEDGDKQKYDKVVMKFERYCEPQSQNLIYFQHKFFTRDQKDGESYDKYLNELNILAEDCKFDNQRDILITSRLTCGIKDNNLRLKLLRTPEITLAKATELCRAFESTTKQLEDLKLSASADKEVNAVSHETTLTCGKCNRKHPPKQCPAHGKQCLKCRAYNHFAEVCHSRHPTHTPRSGQGQSAVRGCSRGRGRSRGRGQVRSSTSKRFHLLVWLRMMTKFL